MASYRDEDMDEEFWERMMLDAEEEEFFTNYYQEERIAESEIKGRKEMDYQDKLKEIRNGLST